MHIVRKEESSVQEKEQSSMTAWWEEWLDMPREKQSESWKKGLTRDQKNEIKVRRAVQQMFSRSPYNDSLKSRYEWSDWAVAYLSKRETEDHGKTSWHTIVACYPEKGYRTQVRIQVKEGHEAPHLLSLVDGDYVAVWSDERQESRESLGELFECLGVVNGMHLVRS